MATALLSPAIKALNSCCGDGIGKIFHKDDEDAQPAPAAAQPVHRVRPAIGAGEVVGPAALRVLALRPSVAVAEALLDLEVVCQPTLATELVRVRVRDMVRVRARVRLG